MPIPAPDTTARPTPRRSFTLVELVVAMVVVSVALVGVFGIFQAVLAVESRTSGRAEQRAAARPVLDHLCSVLGAAVNLPGRPSLAGGVNDDGTCWLECVTFGPGGAADTHEPGLQMRRYEWGGEKSPAAGLVLRVQTCAGRANLTADPGDEGGWDRVPPRLVGGHFDSLSVRYRAAADEQAEWQDRYSGKCGQVAVRVSVAAGDELVERVVIPRAGADLVPEAGGATGP